MKLRIVPLDLETANAYVARHHRHHQPVIGHKFSVGVVDERADLRGVAIIGRPVSRRLDNGWTLEVTRVATDGCANACSALYAAAWRACRAMGFQKLVTYTLNTEPGTSLLAAGWKSVGETRGGSWSRVDRPRTDKHPLQAKLRWEMSV